MAKKAPTTGIHHGGAGGHRETQQQARDHGGEIADGLLLMHELAIAPLKEHARCDRAGHQQQGVGAELPHRDHENRQQRDDHVEHQALGVPRRAYLGLVRYVKHNSFVFLVHHLASFAFSLAALAWNMSLAVLKAWVKGMRAGQLNAQLPHSKQSFTWYFSMLAKSPLL